MKIPSSNHQFSGDMLVFRGLSLKLLNHPSTSGSLPPPTRTPQQNHHLVFNEAVFRRAAPAAGRSKRRVNFLVDLEVDYPWGPSKAIKNHVTTYFQPVFMFHPENPISRENT